LECAQIYKLKKLRTLKLAFLEVSQFLAHANFSLKSLKKSQKAADPQQFLFLCNPFLVYTNPSSVILIT
jgi:hypothetical protein